jgi:flagellar motor switch protein FliM
MQMPSDTPQQAGERVAYDFRRPNRVSKERNRTIQAIFDRLVSTFEATFNQRLRTQTKIELVEINTRMAFGEYSGQLPKPCSAFVYEIGDGAAMLMEYGQKVPIQVHIRLTGGSGNETVPERPLTETERIAFKDAIADRMANSIAEAWAEHLPMKPRYRMFEATPEMLEMAGRDEPVLIALFSIEFSGNASSFSVCFPISALEPFLAQVGGGASAGRKIQPSAAEKSALQDSVRGARVPIRARLPAFRLAVRDLIRLQSGSRIQTGLQSPSEEAWFVEVVPGARAHFLGRLGRLGDAVAVRIMEAFIAADRADTHSPKGRLIMEQDNNAAEQEREAADFLDDFSGGALADAKQRGGAALEQLLDLTLPISVVIGTRQMAVSEILQLARGSVFELDRFVGEPLDVFVGDRKFAEGEIEVAGEHFVVKLTSIVQPNAARPAGRKA